LAEKALAGLQPIAVHLAVWKVHVWKEPLLSVHVSEQLCGYCSMLRCGDLLLFKDARLWHLPAAAAAAATLLALVIRYDLEFLGLCPCMVDVEIIDAKNDNQSIFVSAGPEACCCSSKVRKPCGSAISSSSAAPVPAAAAAGWGCAVG
jgi:hypothetical protein